ncbi:MAG TPA: hypothetical protein VKH45_03675 [Candidatus Acidoferrum sp.]|nr:hypothetical protein [Candidatus Acidoferrum sp.]
MSIDCPAACAYLVSANRYEDQHQRTLPADTPLLDVRLMPGIIEAHQQLLSAIAFTVVKFSAEHREATDPDLLAAIAALANAYKTLASGIVYEQVPALPVQRDLYTTLADFLASMKQPNRQVSFGNTRDSEVFQLLVFLYRMGLMHTNGRPRARRFIEYLRGQFPNAQELKQEQPRIIVP